MTAITRISELNRLFGEVARADVQESLGFLSKIVFDNRSQVRGLLSLEQGMISDA